MISLLATRHLKLMLAFCTDKILGACRFIDMTGQSHNVLNLLLTEFCTATNTMSYSHCSDPHDMLCKQTRGRLPVADTIMQNDPALDACLLTSTGV